MEDPRENPYRDEYKVALLRLRESAIRLEAGHGKRAGAQHPTTGRRVDPFAIRSAPSW